MALIHDALDALRHPEATLNRARWQEALDRLEDWMHDVERRLDGAATDTPHGLVVSHSPDGEKEVSDAHEASATQS